MFNEFKNMICLKFSKERFSKSKFPLAVFPRAGNLILALVKPKFASPSGWQIWVRQILVAFLIIFTFSFSFFFSLGNSSIGNSFNSLKIGNPLVISNWKLKIALPTARAALPQYLPLSARLMTTDYENVPDTTLTMTFRIYASLTGGTAVWEETQSVPVSRGVFSVTMGSTTSLSSINLANGNYYFTVQISGDTEMSPRKQILPTATALYAGRVQSDTTIPATTVGAGELFFNSSSNLLYASDGTNWNIVGGDLQQSTNIGAITTNAITVGGLTSTGATTLQSTLGVTGVATLQGALNVAGATTLSSTLDVAGLSTLASLTVVGPTALNGDISLGNIFISSLSGNIIPAVSGTYDLGSATKTFSNAYIDNLVVGTSSSSGTTGASFSLNSDASGDETSSLNFYRGGSLTAGQLQWDSDNDRFNLNNPLNVTGLIQGSSGLTISGAINGITISSGALSGVTTINASGAITSGSLTDGAATLSSGALSGITTLSMSGALSGATTGAFSTSITTPLIIGGTATTSDLNLQTTSGVGTTGADMHFLVGNNGATEAMTILNSGNVGIGTTSIAASTKVHIKSGTNEYASLLIEDGAGVRNGWAAFTTLKNANANSVSLRIDSTGAGTTYYSQSQVATLSTTSGVPFRINTNATYNNGLYIATTGNVGIGTTSPGAKLDMVSPSGTWPLRFWEKAANSSTPTLIVMRTGTSVASDIGYFSAYGAGGELNVQGMNGLALTGGSSGVGNLGVYINTSGNVGIGTTGPSGRLDVKGSTADGSTKVMYWQDSNGLGLGAITTDGNVGIGTTGPGGKLEVVGDGTNPALIVNTPSTNGYMGIQFKRTGSSTVGFGNSSGFSFFNASWANLATFSDVSGGTSFIALAGSGKFSVGGTTAGSTLSVNGNTSIGSSYYTVAAPADGMIIQGNVGIGTTSPGSRLAVVGADSLNTSFAGNISGATGTGLVITNAGNVGIGTTSPYGKLDTIGAVTASANYGLLNIGPSSTAFDGSTAGFFAGSASGTQLAVNAVSGFAGNLMDLQVAGVSKFSIDNAGTIGAGTWTGTAIGTGYLDSSVILSTEIDTFSELDTIVADATLLASSSIDTFSELDTIVADATLLHNDMIDASSELLNIMDDETGTGALVFGTSPTFTTSILTPKITNTGALINIQGVASYGIIFNDDSADADLRIETDTNANFILVDASGNALFIGDGGTTNYTKFDTTGAQTFAGSAMPIAEISFRAQDADLPVTSPAALTGVGDANGKFQTLNFDPNIDENADFSFKMPGNYEAGTNVVIELVWMSADTTASHEAVFTADYWAVADSEDLDSATLSGSPVSGTFTDSTTAGARNTHSLTLISPTIAPEDVVNIRLTRDADNVADDCVNDGQILQVNVQFYVNS